MFTFKIIFFFLTPPFFLFYKTIFFFNAFLYLPSCVLWTSHFPLLLFLFFFMLLPSCPRFLKSAPKRIIMNPLYVVLLLKVNPLVIECSSGIGKSLALTLMFFFFSFFFFLILTWCSSYEFFGTKA